MTDQRTPATAAEDVAASIWLAHAHANGLKVTVVGDQVYIGGTRPAVTYKTILVDMPLHKAALLRAFAGQDGEERFRLARSFFPSPEQLEGGA